MKKFLKRKSTVLREIENQTIVLFKIYTYRYIRQPKVYDDGKVQGVNCDRSEGKCTI